MKRYKWLGVLLALGLIVSACGRSDSENQQAQTEDDGGSGGNTDSTEASDANCDGVELEASEIGVTPETIEVMADVGSPLAPGLFQGNFDAIEGFAEYVNANGGIACRQLEVETWDSKLTPEESKNGLINACQNTLAMVGNNALFNPDVTPLTDCVDKAGQPVGLPDIAGLANDVNEQCAPTSYIIQAVAETCPVQQGERPLRAFVGQVDYYTQQTDDPHGIFMVPGDLPTTVQSATYQVTAQENAGITFDAVKKVSGRDEQAAFTPLVQTIKENGSTYVYNGSDDATMLKMRKEAAAQGVDTVDVWACSIACYTQDFLDEPTAAEGTYVWLQFVPFEESDQIDEAQHYLASVPKFDSFGAQAWQAAVLFKQTIDQIVEEDGPNGITRERMIEILDNTDDFTANGWLGEVGKPLKGMSSCFVIMQVENGEFVRRFPEEPGTLDCKEENIETVTLDPAAAAANIS